MLFSEEDRTASCFFLIHTNRGENDLVNNEVKISGVDRHDAFSPELSRACTKKVFEY